MIAFAYLVSFLTSFVRSCLEAHQRHRVLAGRSHQTQNRALIGFETWLLAKHAPSLLFEPMPHPVAPSSKLLRALLLLVVADLTVDARVDAQCTYDQHMVRVILRLGYVINVTIQPFS